MTSWLVDRVYVICHNVKEKERYDRLISHLTTVKIPTEVTEYMAPIWSDEVSNELIFGVYDPLIGTSCCTEMNGDNT